MNALLSCLLLLAVVFAASDGACHRLHSLMGMDHHHHCPLHDHHQHHDLHHAFGHYPWFQPEPPAPIVDLSVMFSVEVMVELNAEVDRRVGLFFDTGLVSDDLQLVVGSTLSSLRLLIAILVDPEVEFSADALATLGGQLQRSNVAFPLLLLSLDGLRTCTISGSTRQMDAEPAIAGIFDRLAVIAQLLTATASFIPNAQNLLELTGALVQMGRLTTVQQDLIVGRYLALYSSELGGMVAMVETDSVLDADLILKVSTARDEGCAITKMLLQAGAVCSADGLDFGSAAVVSGGGSISGSASLGPISVSGSVSLG